MEQVTLNDINKQLIFLRKTVITLQEYMEDAFLSVEDEIALEKARAELKQGKSISLDDLKKKFNV